MGAMNFFDLPELSGGVDKFTQVVKWHRRTTLAHARNAKTGRPSASLFLRLRKGKGEGESVSAQLSIAHATARNVY